MDCGKSLSVTAQNCNACNSTDPFGSKRFNDNINAYAKLAGVLALMTIGVLWHYGIIDPVSWFVSR